MELKIGVLYEEGVDSKLERMLKIAREIA